MAESMELNKAIHKIEFLEMAQEHLRDCLKSAQETLASRNDILQTFQRQLKEERQKYIQLFEANSSFEKGAGAVDEGTQQRLAQQELVVLELNEQVRALKAKNGDLESNNLALYESYKAAKTQFESLRAEYNQLQTESEEMIRHLKANCNSLQQSVNDQRGEIESRAFDVQAQYEDRLRALENENSGLLNQLQTEVQGLQNRLQSMQDDHEAQVAHILSEADQQVKAMMADHQAQLADLEKMLFDQEKDNEGLSVRLQESEQELKYIREEANESLAEKTALLGQVEGLQEKCTAQQEEMASLQNQLSVVFHERNSMTARFEQTQEDLRAANQRQKFINDVMADQTQEIDRLNSVNLQMAKAYREKEKEILVLQERLQDGHVRVQEFELRLRQLEHENHVLRTTQAANQAQYIEQGERYNEMQAKFKAMNEQTENRERQYRFYLENLNRSKRDLREQGMRFIQELRAAKQMSPLHDFLKVTQREVSRVEIQLKRTPTVSSDRSRLEQCLTELIEQRDFLAESLEKTTQDIDKKIARLSEIIGGDTMAMTPPPPPSLEA